MVFLPLRALYIHICGNAPSPGSWSAIAEVMTIDEIIENFTLLEEWDDRYRYVIELGRGLSPLSETDRSDANKVQGCASQVWLATTVRPNGAGGPVLNFAGDSDAHIVRGLIAILFAMFSGRHAREILATDASAVFERLGLREHLTPQRSNGFRSMVERIRSDSRAALALAEEMRRCQSSKVASD
jgi:cysteine desulfuration protein SufE